MAEGNSPTESKEGYFGPLRRRYEPTRSQVGNILTESGVTDSAFKKARTAISKKLFRAEQEGDTDHTGIPNRRGLEKLLSNELLLARRLGVPSVDFEIDLNDLKKMNDKNGHDAGDKLILDFIDVIKKSIRASDAFGRTGGDEFRMVLFGSDVENGKKKWDTIQEKLKERGISVSAGIALVDYDNFAETISKADTAMYQAKQVFKSTGVSQLGVANG